MPRIERHLLAAPPGSSAPETRLFIAQLDDQTRRLTEDIRGLTRPMLEWQPARGMNTIGMLLAHLAVVEVHWIQIGPLGLAMSDTREPLGIGHDDDGMPLPPHGRPPALLAGRALAYYEDLLRRARSHTVRVADELTDADLDREVTHTRTHDRHGRKLAEPTVRIFNLRWVFYHLLEHFAGHYGQILLLRHQLRASRARRPRR